MKFCQLAVPFWLWVILLSCSFRQIYGTREANVHVTVTIDFNDGRHATIACQSFTKGVAEKFLLKDVLTYPICPEVQYDVGKLRRDTAHRCLTIWKRKANVEEYVNSMIEIYYSSWDYDIASVWDPENKVARFHWKVSELGLSLYSYSFREFHVTKPLRSLQFINVYIRNNLQRRTPNDIHISCGSNQPHRHGAYLAYRTYKPGEFVTWSVWDFDLDTEQQCRIKLSDIKTVLSFLAFSGIWRHDDSIWDEETQERNYDWTVQDGGLHVRNFETKEDEFIAALPNDD